jgi:hypothetical protein
MHHPWPLFLLKMENGGRKLGNFINLLKFGKLSVLSNNWHDLCKESGGLIIIINLSNDEGKKNMFFFKKII